MENKDKKDIIQTTPEEDIKTIEKIDDAESKKKNFRKNFLYFLVVLIITVVVLYFNLTEKVEINGQDLNIYQLIPQVFNQLDVTFLLVFIGGIIVTFLLSSFSLFLFAKLYQRHYKYHQALACTSIGDFYSAITPGSSGGQVAQIYLLKKQGVLVSNGASIFVMSFIIYQIVLVIFGIISVATRFDLILNINSIPLDIIINGKQLVIPIWIFIVFGFVINIFVIVLLFFMSLSARFHHFIINTVIGILAKLHLIKNPEQKRENIRIQVQNFRIEFRRLQSNIPFTLFLLIINFIIISIKDLYPLLAGGTLNGFANVEGINWGMKCYDSIVLSNFHQMVTGLIPIPGAAGISEFVFERLFGKDSGFFLAQDFYKHGGSQMVLLFWRGLTFYIPFIINAIVSLTYKTRGLHAKDGVFVAPIDKKTLLTIQLETYDERIETLDYAYQKKAEKKKERRSHHHKEKNISIDEINEGNKDEHSDI